MLRIGPVALATLLAGAVCACGEPASDVPPPVVFEGGTMGTYYRAQVVAGELSEERREAVHAAVVEELDGVNQRMSTYLADSEISRFNQFRETTPFRVSPETFEVFRTAREISEMTGGAFDVTVGPLADAWGFGADAEAPPSVDADAIARILDDVGFDKLSLSEDGAELSKSHGDLRCDLSAIAKGYAVDRVAERLSALGFDAHWVEVGGEVRAAGAKAGDVAWRLGIERPGLAFGSVQRIVPLEDLSVATSGDYRNYREIDGERYSHLIDPRTGWPIRHRLASVSVFHPRCAVADALATAIMVMGEEEGYELALEENLPAFFLVREGEGFAERGTPAFWELVGPAESGAVR